MVSGGLVAGFNSPDSDDDIFDEDFDDSLSEWDQSFLSDSFDFSLSFSTHFFESLGTKGD